MHKVWACYLEGGNNTAVAEAETASLKKVNAISERDFTQLARFVREKPNATSLAVESSIMLGNIKTAQWLSMKREEEQHGRLFPSTRRWQTNGDRHSETQVDRVEEAEARGREARAASPSGDAEDYCSSCNYRYALSDRAAGHFFLGVGGGMATTKKKMEAIKCQLRFRSNGIRQEASKETFAFSKQGRALTLHELTENLLSLIRSVHSPATNLTDAAGSKSEGDDSSPPCSQPPPTTQTDTALRRTPRTTDPTTGSSNYTPPSTEDDSSSPCPKLPPTTQTDTALRKTPRTTNPTACSSNSTPPSTESAVVQSRELRCAWLLPRVLCQKQVAKKSRKQQCLRHNRTCLGIQAFGNQRWCYNTRRSHRGRECLAR